MSCCRGRHGVDGASGSEADSPNGAPMPTRRTDHGEKLWETVIKGTHVSLRLCRTSRPFGGGLSQEVKMNPFNTEGRAAALNARSVACQRPSAHHWIASTQRK